MTFRERGCRIGAKVRFIEDMPGTIRTVETDEQLDYLHLLPWIIISKGPKVNGYVYWAAL